MIRPVTVHLSRGEVALARQYAARACIGGKSHVRDGDRMDMLDEDNLVGQIASYVASRYWTGGSEEYRKARRAADRNPTRGDGGEDILGCSIDFKGSRIRNPEIPLHLYHLAVRPGDRRPGWTYVLVLVGPDDQTAYIMGWATDEDLPPEPDAAGTFKGAYTLRADRLAPLPPLRWWEEIEAPQRQHRTGAIKEGSNGRP